jgi:plastocyanin
MCALITASSLLGLVAAGCAARGGQDQDPETPAKEPHATSAGAQAEEIPNQVTIDNFAFRPRLLTVAAGTKVTWINHDDVPHTATSTAKPRVFNSGTLDTDDKFSYVFTAPGTYEYFCAVHPHMTARIIVK